MLRKELKPGMLLVVLSLLTACAPTAPELCTAQQFEQLNKLVMTDDGQGHGPDVGSDEWQSVVEFKLGLRGVKDLPARSSALWCAKMLEKSAEATVQTKPSFDCNKVVNSSVESLICQDNQLAEFDQRLASVYAEAMKQAVNEQAATLKAEQHGWIKGRNDCWKANELRQCVVDNYQLRISKLQATYHLVAHTGPFIFQCDNNPANELVVTYYQSELPSLIAERGDAVSWMTLQPSASGSRYQGQNESFWEHAGEATVVWGFEAAPLTCRLVK